MRHIRSSARIETFVALVVGAVSIAFTSSCSGSGGPSVAPVEPLTKSTSNASSKTAVSFTVHWPPASSAASRTVRHRQFIDPGTASIVVDVNGTLAATIENPNLAPYDGSTYTSTTMIAIPANPGSDTFVISAYDASHHLLADATTLLQVVAGAENNLSATLNGNLETIAIAPVSSPFVSGGSGAYTIVGQAPQTFVITPEDADGNVIVAPGSIPAISLVSATAADVSATPTSTTNVYAVQAHASGQTVKLTASGTNLAGSSVSATATVTTVAALYVANYGGGGTSQSVTIYPANATGNATPIATLAGSSTNEVAVQFPAVDGNGTLYLSNQGPAPNTIYGPTSGYITMFNGSNQNGDVAPNATIANLQRPEGLAFDSKGDLWVMLERSLVEYGPSPGPASSPIATIGAPNPEPTNPEPTPSPVAAILDGCYGVYVSPSTNSTNPNDIYAACSGGYDVFSPQQTGNATPAFAVEPVGTTADTLSLPGWLGIVADSSGNVYVPEFEPSTGGVLEYSATANGVPAPLAMGAGNGYSLPFDIAIDSAGNFYVSNYGSNSIEIFAAGTSPVTGVATATISGPLTGLNGPYGIAVR